MARSEKKYTAYEASGLLGYFSPAERPMDNMVTLGARGFGGDRVIALSLVSGELAF